MLGVPPPPHVFVFVQLPQLTVRRVPQLSALVKLPQFFPYRAQNAESDSREQIGSPHTLGTPLPAQLLGLTHVPQDATVRDVPQLSGPETVPQFLPSLVQKAAFVSGVQPQTLAAPPPPHVWPERQVPHSSTPTHPSGIWPQFFPLATQVVGVHGGVPQTLAVPLPPHVWPERQVPH